VSGPPPPDEGNESLSWCGWPDARKPATHHLWICQSPAAALLDC
jgi:hypothetical protein